MANAGDLDATVGSLPDAIKKAMKNYTIAWVKSLRFGAPQASAVRAENFGGGLVPFVTSGIANAEVAVPHRLERAPRWLMMGLDLQTVNATTPVLTVTRVADRTYLYVSSPTTNASATVYVE